MSAPRRVAAELLGSGLLATVVVGSGITAQRLLPGEPGLQLLANALATALALPVIILVLGPISGAHLNPVVSLVEASRGERRWREMALYVPSQVAGCIAGSLLANLMFGTPAVSLSSAARLSPPHFLAEVVATGGLILVIVLLAPRRSHGITAVAVGAYVGAAYLFTSSTAFANPALTIGRMFTDSFAGIAPASVLGFIGAQLLGAGLGLLMALALSPATPSRSRPSRSRPSRSRPSA